MSGVLSLDLPGIGFASPASAGESRRGVQGREPIPCYVAGDENKTVATAVQRLLASAGAGPIGWGAVVLVGPVGCGKSHLARGIATVWSAKLGDDAVLVTGIAELRQQLDAAIRTQSVDTFRARVRGVRLLVVEDLHRIHDSAHLREELQATLDELRHRGALFLATSTKPLCEVASLDRGLLSRFAAGLTLDVAPLSVESRAELLRQALRASGRRLEWQAARDLSTALVGDARRALRVASRLGERYGATSEIDQQRVRAFLADEQRPTSPPLRHIASAVARYYGMPLTKMRSSSRKQPVVLARAVAIYLARQVTPLSYDEIGGFFGGRDHTTIMHSHQRIELALPADAALRAAVNELSRAISSP